ncbi:uncharacterized protein F5Z01DRAFT_634573 [Emericellopsis atlantica]|uniref:Uncharacterized protein n=1 Tax=Emericellopsis atlantica TaxID=2614577 RepID=A0A9P8CSY4_9HYPO|nr:uncharacterized protein F5Z01DRAFT_634573 [Emericellopsis atlantica]KAG9256246.1 hypothetical protein F5Z01DRAFT_634573 [Emericellopsis atlantica]
MKYSTILSTLAAAGAVSAQANPSSTPTACPAAGETNAAGDYGCNPNREYPGEACALIGDCYILRGLGLLSTTTSSANPTSTPAACPAAGETNAAGDYGCNPNREYPGEACALIGDCYILRGLGLLSTTTSSANPTSTPAACPAAGETNAAGDYGCNPNREYPGKACALIGDCYILRGLGLLSSSTNSVKPTPGPYSSINTGKPPQPTTFVPATRNVTSVINGVTTVVPVVHSSVVHSAYVTTGADGAVTTVPAQTVPAYTDGPTAGGARLSVAGGLAALAFAAAML